ncbi:TetR/AcrR family transcriptional regulator [Pelagibaculum spongiae]|uniref:HTH tetR-type domain-containing protein n=1 Tax=Pelagibaculum spongiae TaxID=2080658 RepID=A0A2V1H3Q7_9GAMM|nr:TetR/AcrR family transcriptional regulator [Pelagibaculum spongiae]PVZ70649.1 hypothetical protein DC094_08725 [Pelagibaculum spongiae]
MSQNRPDSLGARAILQTATQMFAREGYAGVSMNRLATEAGVSKANIFHHFSNKEALYLAVLEMACESASDVMDSTPIPENSTFEERITLLHCGFLASLEQNPDSTRLMTRELGRAGLSAANVPAEKVIAQFDIRFIRFIKLLTAGQQAGLLREDIDPALLATLMVSSNMFFFQSKSALNAMTGLDFAKDSQGFARGVMDILIHGIVPKS